MAPIRPASLRFWLTNMVALGLGGVSLWFVWRRSFTLPKLGRGDLRLMLGLWLFAGLEMTILPMWLGWPLLAAVCTFLDELTDFVGYKAEFLRLFGFGIDGVDYAADVDVMPSIDGLITL